MIRIFQSESSDLLKSLVNWYLLHYSFTDATDVTDIGITDVIDTDTNITDDNSDITDNTD